MKHMKHVKHTQRKKRMVRTLSILCLLFFALLFTGCTSTDTAAETQDVPAQETAAETQDVPAQETAAGTQDVPDAVTVIDMMGRTITLEEPARRIVALTASDCEILYAIGAGDTLVGRGTYCDYPAEVLEVPAVESGANTNIEEIIALKPDVLLMSDMAQTEDQIAQLEAAGIQVVVSEAVDIEGVYYAIEMIGTLMGLEENAAAVIDSMKATFSDIAQRASGDGSETIYFEVSPLQYGLWTAGTHTFMDEIASMLGLTNCFADVNGWGEISEEQLLERNPDYIVTITMYFGEGPTPEEEILSRAGWENVTAVQNKAILNLQNNELSRPAPRLADGARMLFEFIYGE
ncbi:MAG: ABC transporter substrate-binding protein [Lachnospiraceae bacterium]|nr:ABC transporter substrate-binding protein [Lachnospiraceae bacterium]